MAEKKKSESKNSVLEKEKSTTKKSSSKAKTTKKSTSTNKTNSTKKTTNKMNTNKKSDDKKAVTKTTTKKSTTSKNKQPQKKVVKKDKEDTKVESVELANVLDKNENNDIIVQKIDKNSIKLEEAKYPKRKSNKLLMVGIFIVTLGIIALLLSLVANRIVDREFLSDNSITLMMIASIIIEGFGAFIIINES